MVKTIIQPLAKVDGAQLTAPRESLGAAGREGRGRAPAEPRPWLLRAPSQRRSLHRAGSSLFCGLCSATGLEPLASPGRRALCPRALPGEPPARGEPAPLGSPHPVSDPSSHAQRGQCRGARGRQKASPSAGAFGREARAAPGEASRARDASQPRSRPARSCAEALKTQSGTDGNAGHLVKAAPRNPIISWGTGIMY